MMKFVLSVPHNFSDKHKTEMLTYLDFRSAPTLAKAKKCKFWYEQWFNSGVNHREKQGMVVCESKKKHRCFVVEIQNLKDLIEFQTKHGCVEISNSNYLEIPKEITIT